MKLLLKNKVIVFITVIVTVLVQSYSLHAYEGEIRALASTLATSIQNHGKKVIAVVDFTDLEGNTNELGRFVAEELAGDLINTNKGFDVVDRNHLKSLLAENKLSMSGLIDAGSVMKLGKIAGADALVTGSLTPLGDSIRISCKVIDMSTAKVMGVAKGYITSTAAIASLLKSGIHTDEGREKSTPPVKPSLVKRIEGKYRAAGRNPDGTIYSGIATITKKDEIYTVVWKIGNSTCSGSGHLEGYILTVNREAPYPLIYRVQADGSLLGTWHNGAAAENLSPL